MRGAKGEKGFTVIEILVAVTLLVLGIAGTLSLFVSLSRANGSSRDLDRARMIAEELMEDMRSREVDDVEALATAGLPDVSSATSGVTYHRTIDVTDVDGEDTLVRIRVDVSFTPAGSPDANTRTASLEVIRTRLESL